MNPIGSLTRGGKTGQDRRLVRSSLGCVLFSVAAFYVQYCAPVGSDAGNAALVALLAIAAGACACLALRLAVRPPSAPRTSVEAVRPGSAV